MRFRRGCHVGFPLITGLISPIDFTLISRVDCMLIPVVFSVGKFGKLNSRRIRIVIVETLDITADFRPFTAGRNITSYVVPMQIASIFV